MPAAVQLAFERQASPFGVHPGIEDVALEGPLALALRPDLVHFAHVARGRVEMPVAGRHQRRDLRHRRRQQRGGDRRRFDAVERSLVAGAQQGAALGVEGDGVDDVLVAAPNPARVAVGCDAIDFAAARNAARAGRGNRRRGAGAGHRRSRGSRSRNGGSGRWSGRGQRGRRPGRAAGRLLVSHARRVDGAIARHGHGGHFPLGELVEHEPRAIRRDAQHQAAGIGAGDQVAGERRRPAIARGFRRSGKIPVPCRRAARGGSRRGRRWRRTGRPWNRTPGPRCTSPWDRRTPRACRRPPGGTLCRRARWRSTRGPWNPRPRHAPRGRPVRPALSPCRPAEWRRVWHWRRRRRKACPGNPAPGSTGRARRCRTARAIGAPASPARRCAGRDS